MVLKKIKSIKNFGIFVNYTPSTGLPDFARYNLIYGWNGTGKTTFTRLMRCFETGKAYEDFSIGTFTIDCHETPTPISEKDLTALNGRLKVFNKDFIEENLDLDIKKDGKARSVVHIGKANIERSQNLKDVQNGILEVGKEIAKLAEQIQTKNNSLEKLASSIAEIIKGVNRTAHKDEYTNYDKRTVKQHYKSGNFSADVLTPAQQNALKVAINAEAKAPINFTLPILPDLKLLDEEINTVLRTQILATETIERLKDNLSIENWVRQGISLHPLKDKSSCEFCGNEITKQRLEDLDKHFGSEREKFLTTLDSKISTLEKLKQELSSVKLPNAAEFISEFQEDYKTFITALRHAEDNVVSYWDKVILTLKEKKKNPYGLMSMSEVERFEINILENTFLQKQSDVQALIRKHNEKVRNFDKSIQKDKKILEHSILSAKQPEYKTTEKEIKELNQKHAEVVNQSNQLKKQKKDIENEIQGTKIACEIINANLKDYLGHEEIKFEVFEDGYLMKRNDEIAKNLSEGEKTAIAFVYFIATLKDNFDLINSMIVIDDPVSSLDANNMHHAFHFMVAHTKEAGQLFILTHNFSFLRKVKQWFKAAKHERLQEKDKIESQYYQLT